MDGIGTASYGHVPIDETNGTYDDGQFASVNRLAEQFEDRGIPATKRLTATVNSANQILSTANAGPVHVSGSLDEQGMIVLDTEPTKPTDADDRFSLWADLPAEGQVAITARDWSANEDTTTFEFDATPEPTQEFSYDANGNTTQVITTAADEETSTTTTYEWDAHDRLTAIVRGTCRTEMTYDGFGRRVRIVEKESGATAANRTFLWEGLSMVEERDSSGGTVRRRFFGEGEERIDGGSPLNLYYSRDHLGSVREVTEDGGTMRARYAYEPYGKRTKLTGDLDVDFGSTGHFYHAASGLCLAPFRAYNSAMGRWLNRDPIEESDSPNLYRYAMGLPTIMVDRLGLAARVLGNPLTWLDDDGSGGFFNPTSWTIGEFSYGKEFVVGVWEGVVGAKTDSCNYEQCLRRCLDEALFTNWGSTTVQVSNSALTLALGKKTRQMAGGQPYQSWWHRVGMNFSRSLPVGTPFRMLWSKLGGVIGRGFTFALIFEGFYDLTTVTRCSVKCGIRKLR